MEAASLRAGTMTETRGDILRTPYARVRSAGPAVKELRHRRPGEVREEQCEARFAAAEELFRHPTDDFDVAPDGQRIVALHPADSDLDKPLIVLTGWPYRMTAR